MLRIQDAILYGSKRGSGSGPTPSGSIEISENGTYDVTDKAEAVVDVEPDLTTKQITQNGTYQASSDNADGYSAVTVAVPGPSGSMNITQNGTYDVTAKAEAVVNVPQPSGTKQVTISQNGTTTEDVEDYENAQITVNVPGPSGKITISQNANDIDVSGYALADVNVSGGASNEDAIIDGTYSGLYTNSNITMIRDYGISHLYNITEIQLSNVTDIKRNSCEYCNNLTTVDLQYDGLNPCYIRDQAFRGSGIKALILRNTKQIWTDTGTWMVFQSTPIYSGTGYIYVPAALVDSYKAATNWSNFAAQFRALEDYTVDGTTTGALDPTKI